jgi:asparagine synthase (glutamine-hydrolysing)
VLNRPKRGFTPPVTEWFRAVVARYGSRLDEGALVSSGLLNRGGVRQMLDRASRSGGPDLFMAYKLVLFETWFSGVVSCPHR